MKTKIISTNDVNLENELKEAGKAIREGKLVVFPTETVYGIGANALDGEAVKKIFKAKGRPQDNPLIVHISDMSQLKAVTRETSEKALLLAKEFWPGPLTILFKKSSAVPFETTAGLDTVAVRMPADKTALALISYSDRPIAAPSANTSGKPSPTRASHVIADLFGKVDMIIDGGPCKVGLESTVIDLSSEVPVILRPGSITKEQILKVIPSVEYDKALLDESLAPKSPGQKYRHYSPKAKLEVYLGESEKVVDSIKKRQSELESKGLRVGILTFDENKDIYTGSWIVSLGSRSDLDGIARNLFDALRVFDELNVDVILSEGTAEEGIGKAIFNRIFKASGGNIIYP